MPFKNTLKLFTFSLCCILLYSSNTVLAQKLNKRKIRKLVSSSEINADHFTGFALFDIDENKMIYEQNTDKYFVPASNTKLFTYYAALNMLGDSIPGLRYITRGDSLIFWGTGDPSFLHTTLKSTKAFDLLKNTSLKLVYAGGNYSGKFYGQAWSYDDYEYYYQPEINALPVMDNVALLSADEKGNLQIRPSFLKIYLKPDNSFHPESYRVERNLFDNTFRHPAGPVPADFKQEIPWKTSDELTLALLQDTLKKPVGLIKAELPANAKTLYSAPSDSVYKQMLWPSDNFAAEQLLLVCSSILPGPLSARKAIEYSKKNFLNDLPQEPKWVDGSGMSRDNMFTPASIIALLQKIRAKVGDDEKLYSLLPAGGVSGTLRSAYKTDNGKAFVWAKTGTLTATHNQSGYLITRKGKKLIYSYMNNNFTRPTRDIRGEMVRIMTEIHNRY